MQKTHIATLAAIAALGISSAHAQIAVDLSQSRVSVQDSQSLKIENLAIPGIGSFQLNFQWNPNTLNFEPKVETLFNNGAYCESAIASGSATEPANINGYDIRQRTIDGITMGAITVISNAPYPFTASWAKTRTAEENPYLIGREITTFDSSKAYGVVGFSGISGMLPGAIVEVDGGFTAGAFNFYDPRNRRVTTFTLSAGSIKQTTNCAAAQTGLFSGQKYYSDNDAAYQVSIISANSGSITNAKVGSSPFTATWGNMPVLKRGFGFGTLSSTNETAHPHMTQGVRAFVSDVGNGIAITSINESRYNTGSAVFLKPVP